jgi:hypothetical protein
MAAPQHPLLWCCYLLLCALPAHDLNVTQPTCVEQGRVLGGLTLVSCNGTCVPRRCPAAVLSSTSIALQLGAAPATTRYRLRLLGPPPAVGLCMRARPGSTALVVDAPADGLLCFNRSNWWSGLAVQLRAMKGAALQSDGAAASVPVHHTVVGHGQHAAKCTATHGDLCAGHNLSQSECTGSNNHTAVAGNTSLGGGVCGVWGDILMDDACGAISPHLVSCAGRCVPLHRCPSQLRTKSLNHTQCVALATINCSLASGGSRARCTDAGPCRFIPGIEVLLNVTLHSPGPEPEPEPALDPCLSAPCRNGAQCSRVDAQAGAAIATAIQQFLCVAPAASQLVAVHQVCRGRCLQAV